MLLVLWKKWLNPPDNAARSSEETPEQWVESIHNGDSELRNQLIQRYHPYILKTTSRFFRRYIDPQRDDEFSVALAAFDEAITRYSPEGGRLFLGFAETVITRRLIDYVRQEKKHAAAVPYSAFDSDSDDGDAPMNRVEVTQALEVYNQQLSADERRMEIGSLTEELSVFGITFADLVDHSPRHQDSRRTLLAMGKRLALNEKLFRMLRDKRQLPIKELCENESVSRKTIERHRKYLIAISLIAHGAYPYLKEYIGLDRNGKEETI